MWDFLILVSREVASELASRMTMCAGVFATRRDAHVSKHRRVGSWIFVAGVISPMMILSACQVIERRSGRTSEGGLAFRAMLVGDSHPDDPRFWNQEAWRKKLESWRAEGFNALVWYGPNELTSGENVLVRHARFPEANELPPERQRRLTEHMSWRFRTAKALGLRNFLMTQHVFYTGAFADAHGLDDLAEVSTDLSRWHIDGYPDWWRGGLTKDCGVWNEDTRAYIESLYREIPSTYRDLDGFYGFLGEPMPGDRARLFREAIAPGLKQAKKHVLFIANQWQVPLESFVDNVLPSDVYDNTWLGFHGYNSESLTDTKPYPGVVFWAEATELPTVVDIYPGNQLILPLNSPRLAAEIVAEIKKVSGCVGFVYWERHVSGALLGPLFRKALARYSSTAEEYSDAPWLDLLTAEFGDREAARHMLRAFDLSSRIILEKDALVYSGGDVLRRELRLPYDFFLGSYPWSHMTSPGRGGQLIPVYQYARFVARDPSVFRDRNGAELDREPFYQQPLWNGEGGSIYNVTPPEHMRKVRELGEECWKAAEAALPLVKRNREQAQNVANIMGAYRRLSAYYEKKVAAAVEAIVYAEEPDIEQRQRAEDLAAEAYDAYREAAFFMDAKLNPYFVKLTGAPLTESGASLEALIQAEEQECLDIASLFSWPDPEPTEPSDQETESPESIDVESAPEEGGE